MPTSRVEYEDVEEVYEGIEEFMKFTKPHDNVVIMWDFNAVVVESRENREVGGFGLRKKKRKRRTNRGILQR